MAKWKSEWDAYNAGDGPRPEPRHDESTNGPLVMDVDGRPMWMVIEKSGQAGTGEIVNHPPHYTWHPSGVEAISIIEEFPHNLAAAIGYIWRSDHKGRFQEDIEKAIWHLRREIDRRKRGGK